MMFVLTPRLREWVQVGRARLMLDRDPKRPGQVRLIIEAPHDVPVLRDRAVVRRKVAG